MKRLRVEVEYDLETSGQGPTLEYVCQGWGSGGVRGAGWSPDGSQCLLWDAMGRLGVAGLPDDAVGGNDRKKKREGAEGPREWPLLGSRLLPDVCYAASWYPGMRADFPASHCFLTCSKHQPLLLRHPDPTLSTRATYTSYNHLDECETFISLCWSPDGSRIFAGADGRVSSWDVQREGRPLNRWLLRKSRSVDTDSLRPFAGLASCMQSSPDGALLAVGSYGGNVGLFSPTGGLVDVIRKPQPKGVTQVKWGSGLTESFLFVGGRKSSEILAYDIRRLSEPVLRFPRVVSTHQHVDFDLTAKHLWTGDTDFPSGLLAVFDAVTGAKLTDLPLHNDVIGSVHMHPMLPLMLTTTGRRHFPNERVNLVEENVAALWRVPHQYTVRE